MTSFSAHLGQLFRDRPRDLLAELAKMLGARWGGAIAIFDVRPDRPVQLAGAELTGQAQRLQEALVRHGDDFAAEIPRRRGSELFLPVVDDELLAVVVLRDCLLPDAFQLDLVKLVAVALGGEPPELVLEATDDEAAQRRALERLADRHEWNLAAVARFLGWSRTTLYKRMKLLKIPRRRVQKSRKGDA